MGRVAVIAFVTSLVVIMSCPTWKTLIPVKQPKEGANHICIITVLAPLVKVTIEAPIVVYKVQIDLVRI